MFLWRLMFFCLLDEKRMSTASNMKKSHRRAVAGSRCLIDASSWLRGTYVVRAVLPGDDEPLVEKIQVK